MNERVIQGIVIPFRPRLDPVLPKSDSGFIPGEIINITRVKPLEPASTIIVVSPGQHILQYATTAKSYVDVGGGMSLVQVENAKHNTGGYSLRVPRLHLPEDQLEAVKKGDILGDTTTWAAVVGEEKDIPFIVTSSPVNPFTGEQLTPPNILQFPQQETQTIEQPAAISASQNSTQGNLSQFIRPLTDADLNKAA